MAEVTHLIDNLQASKAQSPVYPLTKPGVYRGYGLSSLQPILEYPEHEFTESETSFTGCDPIPSSFVEALQIIADGGPLPPNPVETQGEHFTVGLNHVFSFLNAICPPNPTPLASATQTKEALSDIANDLAIITSKHIFAAAQNPLTLQTISQDLNLQPPTMANRFPSLTTSDLPKASAAEQSATASPARGTAMLNSIFKAVRVPEFRFRWQFWAEKGQQTSSSKDKSSASDDFASRPKPLGDQIISIKDFYQHFNNIPTDSLKLRVKLRDSIHLFHSGVKPLWEDPRNTRGGAYYFRIGKAEAEQFWHEICLLAVGDVLQGAVETKREGKLRISKFNKLTTTDVV
jgi:hypothetical protein